MTKQDYEAIYINEKQAAKRYGLSISWFQKQRWLGTGPGFMKLKSRVLYPVQLTDEWFTALGLQFSTSQTNDKEFDHDKRGQS